MPLTINSASNLWVVISSTDLEYPAGSVEHSTDTNSDWTLLNGNWYHLPRFGINASWEIKLLMNAASNPPTQYTVTVASNNDNWGTVTGGGTYSEGTTIQLIATPANGYRFDRWNDGNTDNPRTVTVTANVTYIATFVSSEGIDEVETATITIAPNPARKYAVVNGLKAGTEVSVVDVNGKVHLSLMAQSDILTLDVSDLAIGVYFVRVNGGTETAIRKLIVK